MAITPELIEQINELAAKKKSGTITKEELELQKELRQEYLKRFRAQTRQVFENVEVLTEMKISKLNVTKSELIKLDNEDRVMRIESKATEYVITYKMREISEEEIMKIIKEC